MSRLLAALAGDPEIEALLSDQAQVAAILRFEVALAHASVEVGLVSQPAAHDIDAAVRAFAPDWPGLLDGMRRDGVVVPSLVAQLRAMLPANSATSLHKGATSQDALDTALVLHLVQILPLLLARIDEVRQLLGALVSRFGSNALQAHTRMQIALPFTVADKLATWDQALERHRTALSESAPDLLVVQLGGPIGNRSSFQGHGDRLASELARSLGLRSVPAWHTTRDRVVSFGSRLAMLAGSLGKIGADLSLMAQSEISSVTLAGGGASSAMPHKVNPVAAEILVALAYQASGLASTLQRAMIHENERSGSAWTLEWLTLSPLIVATGASLKTAIRLLSTIVDIGNVPSDSDKWCPPE